MYGEQKIDFNLDELRFYFDSQEKNVIDYGRHGYKAGVALSLRHKLLSLNEKDFDMAVHAINRIITPYAKEDRLKEKKAVQNEKRDDGQELFTRAGAGRATGDEVNRV